MYTVVPVEAVCHLYLIPWQWQHALHHAQSFTPLQILVVPVCVKLEQNNWFFSDEWLCAKVWSSPKKQVYESFATVIMCVADWWKAESVIFAVYMFDARVQFKVWLFCVAVFREVCLSVTFERTVELREKLMKVECCQWLITKYEPVIADQSMCVMVKHWMHDSCTWCMNVFVESAHLNVELHGANDLLN